METSLVNKAVIPAAGRGVRMLPMTKVVPKELFPVGRKPMIQHAVEEAIASGIENICVVIHKEKESIRDYLEEEFLTGANRCELTFAYQEERLGLGDALARAGDFVGRDPFVMIIPDQLLLSRPPATLQLVRGCEDVGGIWSSMVRIPQGEARYFVGSRGYDFERLGRNRYAIKMIYSDREAAERYKEQAFQIRGFGRTVFPAAVLEYFGRGFINPETGEVDLLKSIEEFIKSNPHYGTFLKGRALDLGTLPGYYYFLRKMLGRKVPYEEVI